MALMTPIEGLMLLVRIRQMRIWVKAANTLRGKTVRKQSKQLGINVPLHLIWFDVLVCGFASTCIKVSDKWVNWRGVCVAYEYVIWSDSSVGNFFSFAATFDERKKGMRHKTWRSFYLFRWCTGTVGTSPYAHNVGPPTIVYSHLDLLETEFITRVPKLTTTKSTAAVAASTAELYFLLRTCLSATDQKRIEYFSRFATIAPLLCACALQAIVVYSWRVSSSSQKIWN